MSYSREHDAGKDQQAENEEEELLLKIQDDMYKEWMDTIKEQEQEQEQEQEETQDEREYREYLQDKEDQETEFNLDNFKIGDEVITPITIERTDWFLHRRWSCGIISDINNNEIKIKIYDFEYDEDAYDTDYPTENIEIGTDAYVWIKELSSATEIEFDTSIYTFEIYKMEHVLNDEFKKLMFYNGLDEFHNFIPVKQAWCEGDTDNEDD